MENERKETKLNGLQIFLDDIDITLQEGNVNGILITDESFANMMGITKKTTQRWRKDGKIAYVKMSRKIYYTTKEVERFVKAHELKNAK